MNQKYILSSLCSHEIHPHEPYLSLFHLLSCLTKSVRMWTLLPFWKTAYTQVWSPPILQSLLSYNYLKEVLKTSCLKCLEKLMTCNTARGFVFIFERSRVNWWGYYKGEVHFSREVKQLQDVESYLLHRLDLLHEKLYRQCKLKMLKI